LSHGDGSPDPWLHLRGETTFATELAAQENGVRFSPDEWIVSIFGGNTPEEGWSRTVFDDRYSRVRAVVDAMWPSVIKAGVDVILDYGFWRRADRDNIRRLATESGATTVLYDVRCSEDVAQARCADRNKMLGGSFFIDDVAYTDLRQRFEPLGDDEPSVLIETG
jgi:predicted kinase